MGLIDEMRSRALEQRGAAWVKSDGSRRAEMPVTAFDGNGLVSKLEILRGDLVDVLYQATRESAEYRFGTSISDVQQADDGAEVTFADGTAHAGGPGRWCRRPAFRGATVGLRSRGTVRQADRRLQRVVLRARFVGLDGWFLLYQAPGGLNASMRPSHDPSIAKAGLAFQSEPITYDRRNLDEQRQILVDRFAGAGWECDALLTAAQEADDFYFDSFAQVHMPSWSSGRVALVGDAGYCASPLSGMGTSLALVGTYVLAGELGAADSFDAEHIQNAFRRYGTVMRPYVDKCQDLPNTIDRYAPRKAADITANALVMKWMQRWPFRPVAAKLWFTTADSIDLPDYPDVRD